MKLADHEEINYNNEDMKFRILKTWLHKQEERGSQRTALPGSVNKQRISGTKV